MAETLLRTNHTQKANNPLFNYSNIWSKIPTFISLTYWDKS